jgi:hypothetical protein
MAKTKKRRSNLPLALLIVVLAGLLGWRERLALYDWYRLVDYRAPIAVQMLADETAMTPYARHLFYVYHPQIEDATAFNKNCQVTVRAIVQGCTINFRGIYLYNVQDPELNGIEQVTAAYEMLHVGYARLSPSQRTYINGLVMQAFQADKASSPFLEAEEQSYLQTEGAAAVPNELHSMMGTEVAKLPPALETYYKKYFKNRQVIIRYENQYQAVFTQRQQIVTTDDQQLTSWLQTITKNETSINAQKAQLASQKDQLSVLLSGGQGLAYDAIVPAYNTAVGNYDTLINQTRALITDYNQLVMARNAVAVSINQLYQTISSQPITKLQSTVATQ